MAIDKTDGILSAETDKLIWEFRRTLTYREIVQAVARARVDVRDGYRNLKRELPEADEYVALVIGLARQRIEARFVPAPLTLRDAPPTSSLPTAG